jgi:hypothetical protein
MESSCHLKLIVILFVENNSLLKIVLYSHGFGCPPNVSSIEIKDFHVLFGMTSA